MTPGAASAAAGRSVRGTAQTVRARILAFISKRGGFGATCDDVEWCLMIAHQTCSARIKELRDRREIIATDRTRLTRSGRPAVVYVAA